MSPTDYFSQPEQPPGQPRAWSLADVYADLATEEEVAQRLDVRRQRVREWTRKRDMNKCPLPIKMVARTYVYSFEEWRDWFDRWLRAHPNHQRVQRCQPHGGGQPFWSFFGDKRDDD